MARYVRLERPVHYGNVGQAFKESKPPDDPYLFPPENTRDVWAHAKQITDRYGFSFYADENGDFVLMGKNNPTKILDLLASGTVTSQRPELVWPGTSPVPTLELDPAAYGGTYLRFASGTVSQTDLTGINAARIDLVLPLGPNLGNWTATVLSGMTVVSGPITIVPTATEELYFYDYRTTIDGTNSTVVTIYSGFYTENLTVRLASTGANAERRLDCLQLWAVDPNKPLLAQSLSTDYNATQLQAVSAAADQRNYVIVVGRRQSAVTDSSKLGSTAQNPSSEFVVASAVDVNSITGPTLNGNPNPIFTGGVRESIIYDDKVTDQDFAEYLARTFIYRYRMPHASAQATHTLLAPVQLGDPVYVEEPTYDTLNATVVRWIQTIRHEMRAVEGGVEAKTELELTSYPEYPSYNPREDIDIDRFYNGKPVTNVAVTYTSLSNHTIQNAPGGMVKLVGEEAIIALTATASGSALSLGSTPWPPVLGTVYITPTDTGITYTPTSVLTDPNDPWVRPGGSFPRIFLEEPKPQSPITDVKVRWMQPFYTEGRLNFAPIETTAQRSSREAQTAIDTATGYGFWYEYDDYTQSLVIYRLNTSPQPDTPDDPTQMYAEVYYVKAPGGYSQTRMTNTPYQQMFLVNYGSPLLMLTWNMADRSAAYQPKGSEYVVEYRALGSDYASAVDRNSQSTPESPFYDPYTSELGELVEVSFDALVSGNYRISIRSTVDDTVVAYLTNATADATDEDAHWEYFTAGKNRKLYWDGVDQVGDWNIRQSSLYAEMARGVFPSEERPTVGKGFYAWNREERNAPLAMISGLLDNTGKPVFGHNTFSEWYVYFEATNERLEEIYEESLPENQGTGLGGAKDNADPVQPKRAVRVYSTHPDAPAWATEWVNDEAVGVIYTHLPHPTRVAVSWADWYYNSVTLAGQPFDETNYTAIRSPSNWTHDDAVGGVNADAIVNNRRPARIRYTMKQRPGVLWAGKEDEQSVRLLRTVHLRRNLMDQFVEFAGTNIVPTTTEYRRVVSRRTTNDDHTWVFADDGYRLGKSFADDSQDGTEWIFQPKHCEKDFRGRGNESLKFADYLQLDALPSWDPAKPLAGKRSRFQIAFINDLFYLSTYTQDRSGRYQWCIDESFVDQSKILYNTTPTDWPDDPLMQHRRFVLCRQWSDEEIQVNSAWLSYAQYLESLYGSDLLITALAKHYWDEHKPGPGTIGGTTWAALTSGGAIVNDPYTTYHTQSRDDRLLEVPHGWASDGTAARQLSAIGSWSWESNPLWAPSITRDFHGYWCVPPMASAAGIPDSIGNSGETNLSKRNGYTVVFPAEPKYDKGKNTGLDEALMTLWQSKIRDNTEAVANNKRFEVSTTVNTADSARAQENWITANALDYQRQDDLVHYEQLRGTFTRGPMPEEKPMKQDSVSPYFQNVFTYTSQASHIARGYNSVQRSRGGVVPTNLGNSIPAEHEVTISNFFMMAFRTQYLYESPGLFPVTPSGQLAPGFYNSRIARIAGQSADSKVRYDGGAWTGWKDEWDLNDGSAPKLYWMRYASVRDNKISWGPQNIFTQTWLPWCPVSRLPQTRRMLFHLVLVSERREQPV